MSLAAVALIVTKPFRVLIWHDESDSLVEINDPYMAANYLSDGLCADVTDIPEWEERIRLQKEGIDWQNLN